MWNNVLYNKVGTFWKISSSGANYNPCSVDSAYEVTDYTNLRCVNNYQVDYGTQYNGDTYLCEDWGNFCKWGNSFYCKMNPSRNCTVGNTTLYQGGFQYHEFLEVGEKNVYSVRRVDNLVEYKSFSSF